MCVWKRITYEGYPALRKMYDEKPYFWREQNMVKMHRWGDKLHTLWEKKLHIGHFCAVCHQCLAMGTADQVSQLSGLGLVVMCRLRPVDSMHLARKKGSPRCAVKRSCRELVTTVPNILQNTSSRKPSQLKITIWAVLDVPDAFFEIILDF